DAATVSVGHQPENESAHGPEGERERDRQRHRFVGLPELLPDGGQREGDEKEVEGIERPAEEAGDDGCAVAVDGGGGVFRGRGYLRRGCHASSVSASRGVERDGEAITRGERTAHQAPL